MFGLGPWELLLIFLVILLVFGARRLPEIAKGMGKGIKEFKHAMKDTTAEIKSSMEDEPASSAPNNSAPAEPKDDEKK